MLGLCVKVWFVITGTVVRFGKYKLASIRSIFFFFLFITKGGFKNVCLN